MRRHHFSAAQFARDNQLNPFIFRRRLRKAGYRAPYTIKICQHVLMHR
jgi:hypothetical protein